VRRQVPGLHTVVLVEDVFQSVRPERAEQDAEKPEDGGGAGHGSPAKF